MEIRRPSHHVLLLLALAWLGCTDDDPGGAGVSGDPAGSGVGGGDGASPSDGAASGGDPSVDPGAGAGAMHSGTEALPWALLGAPMPFAPTADSFELNAVLGRGAPGDLRAQIRAVGETAWRGARAPATPADDVAQWRFSGLSPETRYEYRVTAFAGGAGVLPGDEDAGVEEQEDGEDEDAGIDEPGSAEVPGQGMGGAPRELYRGEVVTQRPPGSPFSFSLLTDTHISPRALEPGDESTLDYPEQTLAMVAKNIAHDAPDFMVNLGDMLDFHLFGFNDPPPDALYTKQAYMNYRRLLGDALGHASHFLVIGNWDGESGDYTEPVIERSRSQRLLYAPGPEPDTYPEGGSPVEDYYAFTWGDALFVVLNVMTYTPTSHLLSFYPGEVDDWTLGEEQLAWLEDTLAGASSRWRFLLIHHAVGGAAPDIANAAYGRGGGQAASVGEQARVHKLMLDHDVRIFFYGHDHVFTDMVVDDIHYTLPGSAGAPWKFSGYETGYTDYWVDSGHARVRVEPESVDVEFVAIDGTVIHDYTVE